MADFSRRGWIDGFSSRLPGIVARPPEPSGLLSAFMSDIFWTLSAGRPFVCPVRLRLAWWNVGPLLRAGWAHCEVVWPEPDQRFIADRLGAAPRRRATAGASPGAVVTVR